MEKKIGNTFEMLYLLPSSFRGFHRRTIFLDKGSNCCLMIINLLLCKKSTRQLCNVNYQHRTFGFTNIYLNQVSINNVMLEWLECSNSIVKRKDPEYQFNISTTEKPGAYFERTMDNIINSFEGKLKLQL